MDEQSTNQSRRDTKKKIWNLVLLLALLIVLGLVFLYNPNDKFLPDSGVEGCEEGDLFSKTTGEPCTPESVEPCKEGDLYHYETGEPCNI